MTTFFALLYHYICISLSFSICDQLLNFINAVYLVGIFPLRTCRLLFFWICKGVFFPLLKNTHSTVNYNMQPYIVFPPVCAKVWIYHWLPELGVKSNDESWTFSELQNPEIICQGFLRFSFNFSFILLWDKTHINERRHIHFW